VPAPRGPVPLSLPWIVVEPSLEDATMVLGRHVMGSCLPRQQRWWHSWKKSWQVMLLHRFVLTTGRFSIPFATDMAQPLWVIDPSEADKLCSGWKLSGSL
jgi:hypothetical protein